MHQIKSKKTQKLEHESEQKGKNGGTPSTQTEFSKVEAFLVDNPPQNECYACT